MLTEHQYTKAIQMSLQTAELQVYGAKQIEELSLAFSLMSIARGNCNIQIKPIIEPLTAFLVPPNFFTP